MVPRKNDDNVDDDDDGDGDDADDDYYKLCVSFNLLGQAFLAPGTGESKSMQKYYQELPRASTVEQKPLEKSKAIKKTSCAKTLPRASNVGQKPLKKGQRQRHAVSGEK